MRSTRTRNIVLIVALRSEQQQATHMYVHIVHSSNNSTSAESAQGYLMGLSSLKCSEVRQPFLFALAHHSFPEQNYRNNCNTRNDTSIFVTAPTVSISCCQFCQFRPANQSEAAGLRSYYCILVSKAPTPIQKWRVSRFLSGILEFRKIKVSLFEGLRNNGVKNLSRHNK